MKSLLAAALLLVTPPALAQMQPNPPLAGTRLGVVATARVSRVPDLARISAGVVAIAPTASAALAQNAQRMAAVRAALRRTGIEDRDIMTSAISLSPQYGDTGSNRRQRITGYEASNEVTIRFHDVAAAGAILDALVAEGANQMRGPQLEVSRPDEALDEARVKAIAVARARADLYARAIGKRVARILTIDENGDGAPFVAGFITAQDIGSLPGTRIEPGEQTLSVTLSVTFELD